MIRVFEFLRKHILLVGLIATLAPLLALLGLQYVWLDRLAHVTMIAHQAALHNSLEAIESEVQDFYRATAEKALHLSPAVVVEGKLDKLAWFWKKNPVEGARRLFLVDFTQSEFGNYYVFDPSGPFMQRAPASDEALAMIVASTPWHVLTSRRERGSIEDLRVDERDPENRILVRPIADEASKVVGLAGMILDESYFKEKLLPKVVEHVLRNYFPGADPEDLSITVRDTKNRVVLALGGTHLSQEAVRKRLPFVFSDWTLVLHSREASPERWARASFLFNMTLAVLLALALAGGLVLALRAADRAMRLSEMKSDFVSNVSHELRTPLASIRVFAELLRLGKAPTPERAREYGDFIETESRRLSRLIDNILDFSRIESGRKTYQFVPCDLETLVDTTLKSFEVRFRQDGFAVSFDRPGAPLPPAPVDPDAIGQAVYNLLDNAMKYSNGAKEIDVSLSREGGSAIISVRDHGIGVPREEQARIFDRFHRVSTGLVHDVKGAGLGLSIVHHIVRAHRGEVTLSSEPGRGCTFAIKLPLAPDAAPSPAPGAGAVS